MKGTIVIAILNAGSMTGKSQEIADLMDRYRTTIMWIQETKWIECKAREMGRQRLMSKKWLTAGNSLDFIFFAGGISKVLSGTG